MGGFVRLSFNRTNEHIDDGQTNFPVKMVRARMPRLVHLTVNRWARHIDAIIQMVQQPGGQDGHCGNFNGNPDDDTKELINERVGAPVPEGMSLFPSHQNLGSETVTSQSEASLADCSEEVKARAQQLCEASFNNEGIARTEEGMQACVFDVCFGGEEFAGEDAATEREAQNEGQMHEWMSQ